MNKEQFLNTGLLEQYALGLTNEDESQEVEMYLDEYPELRQDVYNIRKAIEQYALQQAVNPPSHVKSEVISTISELEKAKRAKLRQEQRGGSNYWLNAAAVLASAITVVLFFLYTQQKDRFNELSTAYSELQVSCESEKNDLRARAELYEFLKDPETQKIYLNSIQASNKEVQAVAYWNKASGKAYVNLSNLPKLDEEYQYQIWADVDHVMINAGLLAQDDKGLQEINFLDDAESLNITVEPKGGSEEPTVEKLIVAGSV